MRIIGKQKTAQQDGFLINSMVRMKGLGHLWRPPDFAIESIAFIGKSVSELPLVVLTLHAWGGGSKSPNRTIIKTRPKGRVFIMVRMKGLEPSRPRARAPKACERVHIQCPC